MKLEFSPVRSDADLALVVNGDVLTVNGEQLDFGHLPEGGTLPSSACGCEFILGSVSRQGGVIHLTVLLPHGPDPTPEVAFPKPINVEADGPVELPK